MRISAIVSRVFRDARGVATSLIEATATIAVGTVLAGVAINGGLDAIRRRLYQPMRENQLPDFVLPLNVVAHGYRVVYEPEAIFTEDALTTARAEYRSMRAAPAALDT